MLDLTHYLKTRQKQVNDKLMALFSPIEKKKRLFAAMQHSLMAGGKRIRPILCISAAEAVGACSDDVLTVACAIECIHTYSLIHDDLPSMDNDDLRRGIPTCHKAFDDATAILAGDALLTLAFELLSTEFLSKFHPENGLHVIRLIAHASGPYGMIEGQMQDITAEQHRLTLDELENLHRLKTGALIAASVNTGALLARATDEQSHLLNDYAQKIGLAFQVIDDVLNIKGDPDCLGKAVGTDLVLQKNTYPGLMGLDTAEKKAHQLVESAIESLISFDHRADPLRSIAEYIVQRDR
ncbi:MAG: polyprenyl synthetase family protein [Candidatus Magnetomorum sp.]|nr:polyprenyl synthetase family protein [Candidatus Magnetomorum sp.]